MYRDNSHHEAAERLARLRIALAESTIGSTSALVSWLSMIYRQAPDTFAHVQRVAATALNISRTLQLTHEQHQQIERAALLHDLGKIVLPDRHDGTAGSAADVERRAHQVSAARTVVETSAFLRPAARIVGALCERVDGTGLPDKLELAAIPIGARVVGVADALDAMTMLCVEMVWSPEVIAAELVRHAGTRFDAEVVAVCLRWMETASPVMPATAPHALLAV